MPWCAAPAVSSTTRACPTTAYAAFVRSPHAHARVRSVDADQARKSKGVLAVLTAQDIKAAGIGSIARHPPVAGRGGAKMAMPFRPVLAETADACRRPGRDGGGGEPGRRAGRRRPRAGRLRGTDAGGRSRVGDEGRDAIFSGRARQSLRRLARHGAERRERARGRRDHQRRAACRAGARRQPAHGGGLDRDARRHRPIRHRRTTAIPCAPARRAPMPCAARPLPSWACRTKNCASSPTMSAAPSA